MDPAGAIALPPYLYIPAISPLSPDHRRKACGKERAKKRAAPAVWFRERPFRKPCHKYLFFFLSPAFMNSEEKNPENNLLAPKKSQYREKNQSLT